jgi:hypothetical protein
MSLPAGWGVSFYLTRTARVPVMGTLRNTPMIRIGAISCCFTNISTAKRAVAAVRAIKLVGQRSQ